MANVNIHVVDFQEPTISTKGSVMTLRLDPSEKVVENSPQFDVLVAKPKFRIVPTRVGRSRERDERR